MTFAPSTHRLVAPLALLLLLMAGCGPATPQQPAVGENPAPVAAVEVTATPIPVDTPAPTDTPEPAPTTAEPTATAQPVAEPAPTSTPEPDWTQVAALVDGLYILGNPNAPIRLIDYSDFF